MKTQALKKQKGVILIYILIIMAVVLLVTPPLIAEFLSEIRLLSLSVQREQAFQIAEAGIDYFRWHLAHNPTDYQDGTGHAGPYVHSYTDFDTEKTIGSYSLSITAPLTGSSIVTIQSTGFTSTNPSVTRTITAKFGIPSLAKYAILNNGPVWIYYSPQVFSGQVYSNNGVRFDVTGNAPIYSAKSTYTCPSWQQCSQSTEPGVWGSGSSTFWQYPVPAIDFSSVTSDLATMKSQAQSGGIYLPPSGVNGYSLVFNGDGTVTIYKVINLISNPSGGTYDVNMNWITESADTDYNQRTLVYNSVKIPSNGIIYVEDNAWVEGTVNGRVTVAAAQLPYNSATAPTIYIPNNIIYSAKDGSCVLGLIGQKDIIPTYHAPNNLEVDAAVISQNSNFQFFDYGGDIKNNLNIYGSIMEYGWWFDNFVWTAGISNNVLAGYANSNYNYDTNLLYGPPPSFPLSSSDYQLISWTSN